MARAKGVYRCFECGLPDAHNGEGDGIGSCMCSRCESCGAAPGLCGCEEDAAYEAEYGPWPDDQPNEPEGDA